jgi:hypothetical protein
MNLPPKLLLFKLLIIHIATNNTYLTKERVMQIAQQIIITNQINDLQNPEQFEIKKNKIITFFNSNYITAE